MDFSNILSVALSSLILLVIIHLTVFYVIRTMYPPTRKVTFAPAPAPAPQVPSVPASVPPEVPAFTEAPNTEKQDAVIPTYDPNVPLDPPRQEGSTDLYALTSTTG
jgi:hypothetical protein